MRFLKKGGITPRCELKTTMFSPVTRDVPYIFLKQLLCYYATMWFYVTKNKQNNRASYSKKDVRATPLKTNTNSLC